MDPEYVEDIIVDWYRFAGQVLPDILLVEKSPTPDVISSVVIEEKLRYDTYVQRDVRPWRYINVHNPQAELEELSRKVFRVLGPSHKTHPTSDLMYGSFMEKFLQWRFFDTQFSRNMMTARQIKNQLISFIERDEARSVDSAVISRITAFFLSSQGLEFALHMLSKAQGVQCSCYKYCFYCKAFKSYHEDEEKRVQMYSKMDITLRRLVDFAISTHDREADGSLIKIEAPTERIKAARDYFQQFGISYEIKIRKRYNPALQDLIPMIDYEMLEDFISRTIEDTYIIKRYSRPVAPRITHSDLENKRLRGLNDYLKDQIIILQAELLTLIRARDQDREPVHKKRREDAEETQGGESSLESN